MTIAEAIVQYAKIAADTRVLCSLIDSGTFLLFILGVVGAVAFATRSLRS